MFLKKGSKFKYTAFAVLTILNLTRLATAGNGTIRGGGDGDLTLESMLPKVIEVSGRQVAIKNKSACLDSDYQLLFGTIQRCGFLGLATCADTTEYYQVNLRLELGQGEDLPYTYIPTLFIVTYDLHGKTYPIESKLGGGGILLRAAGARDNITGEIRKAPISGPDDPSQTVLWGKDTENLTVCMDGQCTSNRNSPLTRRTYEILRSLEAQTDFNSIESSQVFYKDLENLQHIYRQHFNFLNPRRHEAELIEMAHIEQDFSFEYIFLLHLNGDAQRLSDLGASAIRPDGLCDLATYANLTAKLRAWNIGSAAYFYDLKEGEAAEVRDSMQLQAMGIRQKLRRELNRKVVPYCEPASSAGQSQVDLVLND